MIARYIFPSRPEHALSWNEKYRDESPRDRSPDAYDRQDFVQALRPRLRPRMRILDAGCGTGGFLRHLRQQGHVVSGVDTSPDAVTIARRENPEADIREASIEQLPFPDKTFDAYTAIGSWEYPPAGPIRAAQEATRIVKPGGIIGVEAPLANTLRRIAYLPLKRLEGTVKTLLGGTPLFAHHVFTAEELTRLLGAQGCEILDVRPHDLPEPTRHFGLWVDWPFLRGGPRYELSRLGQRVKAVGNRLSPWTISTGVVIVARTR